jgi:hypothetical protein
MLCIKKRDLFAECNNNMGKKRDMASIQLEELRHNDHAVFGQLVIARQSTSEIKEASMFFEKTAPEKRKFEKAKSDDALVLQKQLVYQKSRLDISDFQNQKRRTTDNFKYNGNHNVKNILNRNWRSAELPTMREQRVAGDCFDSKSNPLTIPASTNRQRDFLLSVSNNASFAASVLNDALHNGNRHLSLSNRKSLSFYGPSSLSRESSIEEETEGNEDSISSANCKSPKHECETNDRLRVCQLVDELLLDIYGKWYGNGPGMSFRRRRHSTKSSAQESDYYSTSGASTPCTIQTSHSVEGTNDSLRLSRLRNKSK